MSLETQKLAAAIGADIGRIIASVAELEQPAAGSLTCLRWQFDWPPELGEYQGSRSIKLPVPPEYIGRMAIIASGNSGYVSRLPEQMNVPIPRQGHLDWWILPAQADTVRRQSLSPQDIDAHIAALRRQISELRRTQLAEHKTNVRSAFEALNNAQAIEPYTYWRDEEGFLTGHISKVRQNIRAAREWYAQVDAALVKLAEIPPEQRGLHGNGEGVHPSLVELMGLADTLPSMVKSADANWQNALIANSLSEMRACFPQDWLNEKVARWEPLLTAAEQAEAAYRAAAADLTDDPELSARIARAEAFKAEKYPAAE